MKGLEWLARKTQRSKEELEGLSKPANVLAKVGVYFAASVAVFILIGTVFFEKSTDWERVAAALDLPASKWKVLLEKSVVTCPNDASASAFCPANSKNPHLWESLYKKSDLDHSARIQGLEGKEFWIGTEIEAKELRRAYTTNSNVLFIGWLAGTHRIWIDDQLLIKGDSREYDPKWTYLPLSRLNTSKPLRIAIQIINDAGHPYPDLMSQSFLKTGFYTAKQYEAMRSYVEFALRMRPFSLFIANIIFSTLFFLLWIVNRKRQEYFYFSVFTLFSALHRAKSLDWWQAYFSRDFIYGIEVWLKWFEGIFAMTLGFSFSRIRASFFRILLPVCILAPVIFMTAAQSAVQKFYLISIISKTWLPFFYVMGAASCFLQAYALSAQARQGPAQPTRVIRLRIFGGILVSIALLHYSIAGILASPTSNTYWHLFVQLGLVLMLSIVVLKEYQQQGLLLEKTVVSEYHKRPTLPEKIGGVLLIADLKSSEIFYKHRALEIESENIVSLWRSHFYSAISKHQGIVLETHGDEIIAFFDQEKSATPALLSGFLSLQAMAELSGWLVQELTDRGSYPKDAPGFYFRAALSPGFIKPIWDEIGPNVREAGWEEAGQSTPFVDNARLMDFERDVAKSKTKSVVIVKQANLAALTDLFPRAKHLVIKENLLAKDKHGTAYEIAALDLGQSFNARKTDKNSTEKENAA
jgi:hypothetical protein